MRLEFDNFVLGGNDNYLIDKNMPGLSPEGNPVNIKVPGTDYSKHISNFKNIKIRSFSGAIIGDDVLDYRVRRKEFMGLFNKKKTFTLVDDIENADGSVIETARYQFTGTIIRSTIEHETSNHGMWQLQIHCDSPNLLLQPSIDKVLTIEVSGFVFPLTFPFTFSSTNNTLTLVNSGTAISYPLITITGAGTNFSIINSTTSEVNNSFLYNASLGSGESIVINPIPSNEAPVKKNGISVLDQTNNNTSILAIPPGETTLAFLVDSGVDSNTQARVQFSSAFDGI